MIMADSAGKLEIEKSAEDSCVAKFTVRSKEGTQQSAWMNGEYRRQICLEALVAQRAVVNIHQMLIGGNDQWNRGDCRFRKNESVIALGTREKLPHE